MKRFVFLVLLAGCIGTTPGSDSPPVDKDSDLGRMQGKWVMRIPDRSIQGYKESKITIKGDAFIWEDEGHYNLIRLDEESNPKRIDLLYSDREYGVLEYGIYKFEKGNLIISKWLSTRPKDFNVRKSIDCTLTPAK